MWTPKKDGDVASGITESTTYSTKTLAHVQRIADFAGGQLYPFLELIDPWKLTDESIPLYEQVR